VTRALPGAAAKKAAEPPKPPEATKRDHFRAYLRLLVTELVTKGIIKPGDGPTKMLDTVRKYMLGEVAEDAMSILRDDVAPRLIEVGISTIGKHLFGGK
jgi:hypothetical protein